MNRTTFCILVLSFAAASAVAQHETASLPDAPSALMELGVSSSLDTAEPQTQSAQSADAQKDRPQTDAERRAEGDREVKQQTQQRMLGIVPAFNEVIGGQAVPLTPGQKFHLFFVGSVDPYQFVIAGIDAGLEQAQDEFPEYNQGVLGFTKRYGAAFADNWDGNFWGNAVLPSLLHQDPRYFRLGHGNPWKRIGYTAYSAIRAKGDNGKWQPNYSNVLGNFIGGAISNVYYPASDRGVGLTIERGITVTAEGILGALAEEFYPDYAAWRGRVKARKAAAAAASGAKP